MGKSPENNTLFIVIIVGLLFAFGAFSALKKPPQKQQAITNEAVTIDNSGQIKDTEVLTENPAKEIVIQAKNWEFTPSVITVNQGDSVSLKITSIDVDHGFALPDFGVAASLKPGKTETVVFTADKKGEFTFFCNVFCGAGHKEMKGKLIVQ